MSIADRLNIRSKRDAEDRARAAYEKHRADRQAAEKQAAAERSARLDAYDTAQVQEWDQQRVADELAAAYANVSAAVMETPALRALVDLMDLHNRLRMRALHVRTAAGRLDLPTPHLGEFSTSAPTIDPARVLELAIGQELGRRAQSRKAADEAAREEYAEGTRN